LQNIGVLFLSSRGLDQLTSHLEIGGLLAAGIIMKQIAAMEEREGTSSLIEELQSMQINNLLIASTHHTNSSYF